MTVCSVSIRSTKYCSIFCHVLVHTVASLQLFHKYNMFFCPNTVKNHWWQLQMSFPKLWDSSSLCLQRCINISWDTWTHKHQNYQCGFTPLRQVCDEDAFFFFFYFPFASTGTVGELVEKAGFNPDPGTLETTFLHHVVLWCVSRPCPGLDGGAFQWPRPGWASFYSWTALIKPYTTSMSC